MFCILCLRTHAYLFTHFSVWSETTGQCSLRTRLGRGALLLIWGLALSLHWFLGRWWAGRAEAGLLPLPYQ